MPLQFSVTPQVTYRLIVISIVLVLNEFLYLVLNECIPQRNKEGGRRRRRRRRREEAGRKELRKERRKEGETRDGWILPRCENSCGYPC